MRRHLLFRDAPAWALRSDNGKAAVLDFWFESGRYWQRTIGQRSGVFSPAQAQGYLTVSRASTGFIDNANGLYLSVASGMPRLSDKGLLVEEARTNLALWCRDFTNAAWAKTTMTAAMTATGIDNGANSASTVTATGAAATILQTVTQALTADTVSFFIKRRTGTGTIEVTGDGVAYTDVTSSLSTTAWYRASVSATLVNPVFGIRITTSGDAVDVDFAQLEAGTFATSPILTTTATVTRAADVVTVTTPPALGSAYTLFGKGTPNAPNSGLSNNPQSLFQLDDGSGNNRVQLSRRNVTGDYAAMNITTGGVATITNSDASWLSRASGRQAVAVAVNDQAMSFNGTAIVTSVSALPIAPNALRIGTNQSGAVQWNGYIERIALWPGTRLSNNNLQRITA